MSWKKYGGTNKLDKFNNLSVNTLVADKLSLKVSYIGNWDVSGGISSAEDANFNKNVNVEGTITCGNINILGTLGVLDTRIIGNLTVDYSMFIREDLYLDASGSSFIHADQGKFGFNTYDPRATIDISGNTEASIYVQSSAPSNKNVLAQNATNGAITLNVDPIAAYIDFYVDSSLNQANNPDARLGYVANGFFTIDVSDTMTVKPRTIFSQDLAKTFKADERVIIYGNAETNVPYFPNIYSDLDASFNTGTVAQIIALDNSSNVFVKLATDQGKGMAIGGGYFLNNRIMGTLALTDTTNQKYPALNIISGNLNKNLKTSIAINKPDVTTISDGTNKYAMDINGPIKLVHQELLTTYADTSFQIYATSFYNNVGVVFGSASNTTFQQNFLKTTDGGYTWTKKRIVDQFGNPNPNSLESTAHTFSATAMADSSTIYIVGDTGYIFRSINGGNNWSIVSNNGYNLNFTAIHLTAGTLILGIFDGRIIKSTSLTAINGDPLNTGLTKVTAIAGSNQNNIVIVGNGGIVKYDATTNTTQPPVAVGATMNAVDVYNTVHAVAVGTNVIYYTHNLNAWTAVTFASTILNSVKVLDENRAMATTEGGAILYSVDGFQTWTSTTISTYPLNTISIVNANDFVVSVKTGANTSKMLNLYAPDLLNRRNNNIIEASGNIVVSGDLQVNDKGQILTNNPTFNILPYVAQEINIGNTIVGGNTNVKANLDVTFNITGHQNLLITADSSLNGNLMVVKDTSLNQNLFVQRDTSLNQKLFVNQDTSMNANLYVGRDVSINNKLYVKNHSLFSGDVSLNQNLSLTSINQNMSIAVNKDISSQYALDVSGQTLLRAPLYTLADVSIQGKLFTTQDVSFNTNLYIGQDVSINNKLYVKNQSIFSGDVSMSQNLSLTSSNQNMSIAINKDISSQYALDVSGQTLLRAPLYTLADVSIQGKLFTTQDVSFNANLYIGKDVSINQKLYVKNQSIFGGDVSLNQNLSLTSSNQNMSVAINKDISSQYALDVSGQTFLRAPLYTIADVSIQGKLFTTQDVSFNTNLYIGQDVSINNNFYVKNYSLFSGDVSLNQNLSLTSSSRNMSIAVNKDISSQYALDVSGQTILRAPLYTLADVSIQGKLFTTQDVSINTNLYVGQDVSINNKFYVKNYSLFSGDVSLNQNLSLTSSSRNMSIAVNKDISSQYALDVSGQTNLRGPTTMTGDVSMQGKLFVTQDVSFNTNLYIGQDVSINNKFYVKNYSLFSGDVSLNKNLSLTSSSRNMSIAVNKDISSQYALDVSGQTILRGPTTMTGDVSMQSKLFVTSDVTFNSNLFVIKDVSFNKQLAVTGNAFISKLGLGTSTITSNYTLDVTGNAKIGNNVDVSGSVTVQSNINNQNGTIIQW